MGQDGAVASIVSVNLVFQILDDPGGTPGRTAIDKRPHPEPVYVAERGLQGDAQLDTRHHGRSWQAVYAYADEDLDWWRGHLQRDLAPGVFGENLTTLGLDITGAVIGEVWQIGTGDDAVLLEVTTPRIPCPTFSKWMDEPRWVRRFSEHGAPGAYLRVRQTGYVRPGDPIAVVSRPAHGVRIADVFPTVAAERAEALIAAHDAGAVDVVDELYDEAVRAHDRLGAGVS
jgi:MOSC domain-containing protein YiiM